MESMLSRGRLVACALAAAAVIVAGCGSSNSSSSSSAAAPSSSTTTGAAAASTTASTPASSSSTSSGSSLPTAPTAAAASAAGQKAAAKEGASVKLPHESIGIVNVLQASEAAQRLQAGAEQAAKALGWKVTAVDAAGDPTKSQSDMAAFVNEGVSAIVDLSNPTAAITQALAQARAKNIPVINIGGLQDPSPNLAAQYYGDPTDLTAALDKYMFAKLPAHSQIAAFVSPILLDERKRDAQFMSDAKAAGATVYTYPINLANLSGDATTAAHTALQAHPGLNAFWGDIDGEFPIVAQVLKGANKCSSIGNYNFYDDLINLKTIPTGCGTAVTTSPVGSDGWAAVDQFAEFFARKKSITSFPATWTDLENNIYGVDIRTGNAIEVIDNANLPPAGQYVPPKTDYPALFAAKWKTEFGVG
jgi:ABC-type sugar transport system substrate-binding protein